MKKIIFSILIRGSYWIANAFVSAFTIVYLNRIGFSDWQIGIMISLMGFFSLLLNYLITNIFKKYINKCIKYWTMIIYLLSFCFYAFYEFCNLPIFIKILIFPLAYSLFSYNHRFVNLLCAVNLADKNIKDGNRPSNIGPLAYGITVVIIAYFFDKNPINYLIYWTLFMIALAFIMILFTENYPCYIVNKLEIKDTYKILLNKAVFLLVVAVILSSIGAILSLKFISRVVIENGGKIFNLGIAFAIQSVVIVPVSLLSDKIRKRYDCGKLLLINFFFSFIKILILLLSASCIDIYFAMALTAFGYGGMGFATVDYLKEIAEDENYEMYHEFTVICNNLNLGSLFGGLLSGIIMTFGNVRILLFIGCCITLFGLITMILSLQLRKSR